MGGGGTKEEGMSRAETNDFMDDERMAAGRQEANNESSDI